MSTKMEKALKNCSVCALCEDANCAAMFSIFPADIRKLGISTAPAVKMSFDGETVADGLSTASM